MSRKKKNLILPDSPQVYPTGSCVKTERGYFYIRGPKRYRLPTPRIVESWSFPRIILSTEAALVNYKVVAKMGFRDGSLIYDVSDGKMYLISENKRRHITNPDALSRIGAGKEDAVVVSSDEANLQELGSELK